MREQRMVTERDFRKEEFKDAKPEDYEFRADGEVVRKDRWERAIKSIAFAAGFGGRKEWEISDVVKRVREVFADEEAWMAIERIDWRDVGPSATFDVRLEDGSELKSAKVEPDGRLSWQGAPILWQVRFVKIH